MVAIGAKVRSDLTVRKSQQSVTVRVLARSFSRAEAVRSLLSLVKSKRSSIYHGSNSERYLPLLFLLSYQS
jgi:hypothetical protein